MTRIFIKTPTLERLPPKAEEFFLAIKQTIPHWMLTLHYYYHYYYYCRSSEEETFSQNETLEWGD